MSVEFYALPESPPCRAVEMVASLIGVTLNKHPLNLFEGEHKKEDYLKINPLHKVPYIIDGNLRMGESRAIAAYLVNKYKPDSNLYPQDPVKRAKIDELLHYDCGTLFPDFSRFFKNKIFGQKALEPELEQAVFKDLSDLDAKIKSNEGIKFLAGDDLTIADISIAATLSLLLACDIKIKEAYVLEFLKRVEQSIPEYQTINLGPIENLRNFIKNNQKTS